MVPPPRQRPATLVIKTRMQAARTEPRNWLVRSDASVHQMHAPGHSTSSRAQQERGHFGYFISGYRPSDRVELGNFLPDLRIRYPRQGHGRLDEARAQGITANTLVPIVKGDCLRESDNTVLRGCVGRHVYIGN